MPAEIAVVGGGPAGLIAAETLAAAGADVTIYELRRSVGRKFLLAGRSGLNLTHAEPIDELVDRYGAAAGHLEPAIRSFSPEDLRSWAQDLGDPTFVGTSGRVFPESMRATPLLRAWLQRLADANVVIETGHRWTGWNGAGELSFEVEGRQELVTTRPDATLLALGGASWPRVSSDGSWAVLLEQAGVAVAPFQPANCGVRVAWSSVMKARFGGAPIKNAVFTVEGASCRGDAVVTKDGLEGGPIYALGPSLRAAARLSPIHIDTQPDISLERLVERLSKRRPKASATSWLDSAGVDRVAVALAREATGNELPTAPAALATLLKELPVTVDGLASIDRAISTAGGVRFDAIDQAWMLRNRPGVFVAGEMLDWDAPTGGYLLQACFSSGVAAATGAVTWCASGVAN